METQKKENQSENEQVVTEEPKRGKGRPRGSKNKPTKTAPVASEVATETSDAKSGDTESLFDMRTQEATVNQRSVASSSYDCAHITVVTNGYSIQAKVSDSEGIRQLLDFVKARI